MNKRPSFGLAILASLCGTAVMASDPVEEKGREIFQRTWEHQSAEVVEKREDENRWQYQRRLEKLPGDGLGPMFNATSCEACHAGGGASGVDRNVTLITVDPRSKALIKKTDELNGMRRGADARTAKPLTELYPGLVSPFGTVSVDVVVHEKSARPFYHAMREEVGKHIAGGAPDEWFHAKQRTIEAIAERPVLAGRRGDVDYYLSQRNSPPLYGLGLIDQIEMSRLSMIARSQDRRSQGQISGRVGAGKFGWRAQTPSLDQFVRAACAGEVGLQIQRTPQPPDAADPSYVSLGADLQQPEITALVSYVRSLPPPVLESKDSAESNLAREGKRLFAKVGCALCHVEHVHPARGIYSDLLLHDMGDELQAPAPAPVGLSLSDIPRLNVPTFRPEEPPLGFASSLGYYGPTSRQLPQPYPLEAPADPVFPRGNVPGELLQTRITSRVTWDMLQREWRTPPLWGVADSAPYLHDGRAPTLDAAIRMHGGEARRSVEEYRSLPRKNREKIIAFLATLRSPVATPRQETDRSVFPKIEVDAPTTHESQQLAESTDVFELAY